MVEFKGDILTRTYQVVILNTFPLTLCQTRPELSTWNDGWCFQWLAGKDLMKDTEENMNKGEVKEKTMILHQN